ncbi:MAG TPA: hypothetical protein VNM90_25610 [Haliangium sp.]|nr:hypothetical protein [Haliangium sp.]
MSCVADERQCSRDEVKEHIVSAPKKGNGTVIKALKQDLDKLHGPVYAVLDRDKILELWPPGERPPACLSGIRKAMADKAPGSYDLILLSENVETLVTACCHAAGDGVPRSKPSPDERDRILGKLAWGDANARGNVRNAVPSFERLVGRVASRLSTVIPRR